MFGGGHEADFGGAVYQVGINLSRFAVIIVVITDPAGFSRRDKLPSYSEMLISLGLE